MRHLTALIVVVLAAGALAACGDEATDDDAASAPATQMSQTETAPGVTEPETTSAVTRGEFNRPTPVSARSNIFAAGQKDQFESATGGGGAGEMPPVWDLPAGVRIVMFPRVTGKITPAEDVAYEHGPDGGKFDVTDVASLGGISGIVHRRKFLFLAGVFLTDARPSEPAPPRLNFTKPERFDMLAPLIGQTFFVGDGERRRYRVPSGATRLFLGFADHHCPGSRNCPPGWYDNNGGHLMVTVTAAKD